MKEKLEEYRWVVVAVTVVAVLLAARAVFKDNTHPDLLRTPVYERSVGHALGRAAVNAFPDGGKLLVIRMRYPKEWANRKADGYVDGLKKGLDGSKLRIAGIEPDQPLPEAVSGLDEPSIPMPKLLAYLETYPDIVGVVSFFGFPQVSLADLPESVPPLLVAGSHRFGHGKWVQSGRVVAMVAPRPDVEGELDLSEKRPLEDVFRSLCYLVTADNLMEIAVELRDFYRQ